ncbi:glycoside hydrolase family 55 protein [Aspergillus alliaceus]|uniref:glycoside hydrolase family 55 protein n=1 Tax=Petromyces alliaceus TaxID=209559 RepID=UPI0012A67856|nr:pectate lyase superfamily protein-domain-containing protein [Aspergillus alliaceus]KAB8237024.1 pectate lyase superfamily protein-domain-containing protein [Aspergillus alliaceus]
MAVSFSVLRLFSLCLLFLYAHAGIIDGFFTGLVNDVVSFLPPLDWVPHPTGIPFPTKNDTAEPWNHLNTPPATHAPVGNTSACSSSNGPSSGYWYEKIAHNGQSSFLSLDYKDSYKVFRNVVADYQADNTGKEDAAPAIQKAVEAGASNGPSRNSKSMGTTGQPAVIYLPGGTYLFKSSLQLYAGTVLVGDPTNPPILKAAAGYSLSHMVYAKDPNHEGTNNFYVGIKNIALDSTGVDSGASLALLDWTVSQATQLTNVAFRMPTGSKHVGLTTQYDYNSNIILNDLSFSGGNIGMKLSGQQWVFKNLTFTGTTTGVIAGGTNIVFLGCRFQQGTIGIDASDTSGSLTVIDSSASGLDAFIISGNSGGAGNAIILENVQSSGVTVSLGGKAVVSGSVLATWVHGTLYNPGNTSKERVEGQTVTTKRSSSLLSGDKYYTVSPPTYQEYGVNEVLNVKTVSSRPVLGDGQTDDTANINKILSENKDCKVIYFPAGTYIVTDTIFVPSGTRIIGDAFASTISAVGSNFQDSASARVMVRMGYPGDIGVLQMSDMILTVGDILPGCQMVEVNIAGNRPGDVGLWNTHFRIGGAVGSNVRSRCTSTPENCKAAYGLLHLTGTSSVYIENMWGWTADHDLDGSNKQTISTGRGILVEASAATWLIGTGFEHHTLYQYNFEHAHNVLATMQQSETPYWQGVGNTLAPAPWTDHLVASDPDFSFCAADDATCRMALFERINGASNLFLYGGCNWAFFNNNGGCNGKCQKNTIQIIDSSALYLYGTNTKSTANMIIEGVTPIAKEDDNAGGWGGVVAAFLYNS